VDIVTPGADKDDSAMLTEARNAARLDAANFTNLPAAMLDGNSGTTDQYSNTLQNANEFLTLSVSLFTRAIESRLSQDDVTPEGVTVSFNSPSFDTLAPATGNVGTATAGPGTNGATPA
jgi:phage portal protein BeeE